MRPANSSWGKGNPQPARQTAAEAEAHAAEERWRDSTAAPSHRASPAMLLRISKANRRGHKPRLSLEPAQRLHIRSLHDVLLLCEE